MKNIVEVIKIDFDSSENHTPIHEKSLGMFEDGSSSEELTAFGKAAAFIRSLPPEGFYLGYDGQVYPQFITKKHFLS